MNIFSHIRSHLTLVAILTISVIGFLLIQFINSSGLSTSDSGNYLYIALLLKQGVQLYSEILHTNLPLFPWISVLYENVSFNSLHIYNFTAALEVVATTVCIWLVTRKLFSSVHVTALAILWYLFSYVVLVTGGYQLGVHTAMLFGWAGLAALLYRKPVISGILLGLAFGVKGYMIALIAPIVLWYIITERWKSVRLIIPILLIAIALLLWGYATAGSDFVQMIFGYSAIRPTGSNKTRLLLYLLLYGFSVSIPSLAVLFFIRRFLLVSLTSIFVWVFLLVYSDVYFLYTNMLTIPAVLAIAGLSQYLITRLSQKDLIASLYTATIIVSIINLLHFVGVSYEKGRLHDYQRIVDIINTEKPERLYGQTGLVHGLSYLTGVPVLMDLADTNGNFFNTGILTTDQIENAIQNEKTLVFVIGNNLSQNSVELDSTIISSDTLRDHCTHITSSEFYHQKASILFTFKCF